MLKYTLYFIASISVLGTSMISPAMGALGAYFHDVDPILVKLILTLPALFVIPTSLCSVFVARRYGKKNTLIFALVLYAVSGVAAGLMSDIYSVLCWRALFGISMGLFMPISQSLPADFFEGPEKTHVVARVGSSIPLGNIIFVPISGILSYYSWRYTFLVYAVSIPVVIAVYFFIPNKKEVVKKVSSSTDPLPIAVYLTSFYMFSVMLIVYLFFTNFAIIVEEKGLGSSVEAGGLLAISSITSFLVSFNLLRIKKKLGRYIYVTIPLSIVLSYVIIYFSNSLFFIALSVPLNAYAGGITMPLSMVSISTIVPRESLVKAMAVLTTCMFIGQFISPVVFAYVPDIPGYSESGSTFLSTALFCFVVTVFTSVYIFLTRNKSIKIY